MMAAALGLRGGVVESDGGLLVSRDEYCNEAYLMNHDRDYFQRNNRFINRYLITAPVGYALLLGSSRYESSEVPLVCVGRDLRVMEEVLKGGGWNVECPYGPNTRREDCERRLSELERMDLDKYSCFLFYFSGHGSTEGMLFQPDGGLVSYSKVLDTVLTLDHLRGKPKIFIFDCCRTNSHGCRVEHLGPLQERVASNDAIVCFACTDNTASIALGAAGSIFTQNLANKLQEFGREISLVELLTQARGETYNMTLTRFGMAQEPVVHLGLNYQLLLRETRLSREDRERAKSKNVHMVLVPLQSEVEGKVPLPQSATPTDPSELVMKDHVTRGTRFTSRDEVISNIPSLGRGHHVFLCYLPDPSSPYDTPDPTRVRTNLARISLLHYDLARHGFTVTSDLSLADQEPVNLLQWYIRHIERCDHVILACSPALKELFSSIQPQRNIVDKRAQRFLVYSSAIYSECERCMKIGVGKFIPVVLEREWLDVDQSVPLLFRGSHVYELCEETPRLFDYDDSARHFERLVCRMVGINRAVLNAPQPGAPMTFNSTSTTVEEVNRRKYLAQAYLPRVGYETVESRVGQADQQQPSPREQAWAKVTVVAGGRNHHDQPPTYQTSTGVSCSMSTVSSGVQVYGSRSPATPSVTAAVPSTEDTAPPHNQRHYVAMQYGATPSPVPPPHPPPSTELTEPDPTSLLPLSPPPTPLLLWLSEHVVQWKFLGRYLGLTEPDLLRIALEHPHDIREQCFQMLQTFSMRGGAESTCRKLGGALRKSENNKHLFDGFCDKCSELVPSE